jgi:predicted ABC-type ATPase
VSPTGILASVVDLAATPRLRMFAGPNGSGKSTIKSVVADKIGPELFGVYINADDIEIEISRTGRLDLSVYGVETSAEEILNFFRSSAFLAEKGLSDATARLEFVNGKLSFENVEVNSYFASVAVDFLRQKLLETGVTFTFETVMSHHSKVDFLKQAQEKGFRTYLYYVATEDPDINISRVESRVAQGGHNVSRDKIVDRYYRSLDLLADAVQFANRAYIFDNSSAEKVWVAEVTDNSILSLKTDTMPFWFETFLWDKFGPVDETGG